jgi:hypothetical protein
MEETSADDPQNDPPSIIGIPEKPSTPKSPTPRKDSPEKSPTQKNLHPQPTEKQAPAKKLSPQGIAASKHLRVAITHVLHALEERDVDKEVLLELKDHYGDHEYDDVLTMATTCFRCNFQNDAVLVRLLNEAWTFQWHYYNALVKEADVIYWERQRHEVFVPIEEAEHRLKLERAFARCERVRKELCDLQVRLMMQ